MPDKLTFIDTSCWIEYLRKTSHPIVKRVEQALFANTAAVCRLVLAELLQGAKTEGDIELIKDLASIVRVIQETDNTWERAGLLANKLRKNGRIISLIDCYLAVISKENGAEFLTLDKHSSVIAEVI